MPYEKQKKYFETTYKTGTDSWSQSLYKKNDFFIHHLPKEAMILDLGSGRGLWAFHLAKLGFKVIGLDYVKDIIDKANHEVKNQKLEEKMRFLEADILDIPFADTSFDVVTDLATLQHLKPEEMPKYISEVDRVLKHGGLYYNISLSKETLQFFTWNPKNEVKNFFEKDGVYYNFFNQESLTNLCKNFKLIEIKTELEESSNVFYIYSIWQK